MFFGLDEIVFLVMYFATNDRMPKDNIVRLLRLCVCG